MATQFHDLTIVSKTPQGMNGFEIGFEIPASLKEQFRFVPGQYLTLRAMIDGEDVRRSYSICSSIGQSVLKVGIKRLSDGKFSPFACALEPGDKVSILPPQGRFIAPIGGQHNYLLIAAGSGITPILSIARSVLEGESESSITLVYGNRSTASIMFREALDDLKDTYVDRFRLIHVLSREDQDVAIANGRIDADKISALVDHGLVTPHEYDGIFLCGPQEMIETCSAVLEKMGMNGDLIHKELFTPSDGARVAKTKRMENREKAVGEAEVSIILDGTRRTFSMNGKNDTVLSAANNAGIELPFSCAGGMCCTCRCHISKGEAEMDMNFSLQPWEIKSGFILACQARPKTDELVLDFDAT